MSKGRYWTSQTTPSRAERCTQQVRCAGVTVVAVLLLLLIVGVSTLLQHLLTNNTGAKCKTCDCDVVKHSRSEQRLCETKVCRDTAKRFLDNINSSVKPCENFYQFACRSYVANERTMSVLDELDDEASAQLTRVLEELSASVETQTRPYRQLTQFYAACVSHTEQGTADKNGLEDAHAVFQQAGGWPLLDNFSASRLVEHTTQTLVRLKQLALESASLLNISLDLDTTNLTYVVRKPQLLLPAGTLRLGVTEPQVSRYLQYMRDMLRLYGVNASVLHRAEDILDIEMSLAGILEARSGANFTAEYSAAQLQALPSMNWLPWAKLLNHSLTMDHSVSNLSSPRVLVEDPSYIGQLHDFLMKKREARVLDYVMWRVAERVSPLVSRDLLALYHSYRGQTVHNYCRDLLSSDMNVALSALYLNHVFDKRSKSLAETIVENVRLGIINNIEDLLGEDAESKLHAVERVRGVVARVAYPEQLLDTKLLLQYHSHLTMNTSSFLRMALAVSSWRQTKRKGSDWWRNCDVTRAQATFSVQANSITVNAALLQAPLFSPDLPAYVNYGALGYLAAHHLTHAAQLQGKKLNKSETSIEYKRGLSHVFRAYNQREREEEAGLPGLCQYNSQQLLLISMANMLCSSRTGRQVELRVNTVMSESPEFQQAFNCGGGI